MIDFLNIENNVIFSYFVCLFMVLDMFFLCNYFVSFLEINIL